jgi:2,4-dienoyl-CoA reductase (NADPH2)
MNIAVVGAGPAGLSCAVTAAERGHKVTLFEKDHHVGGQFNLAKVSGIFPLSVPHRCPP